MERRIRPQVPATAKMTDESKFMISICIGMSQGALIGGW